MRMEHHVHLMSNVEGMNNSIEEFVTHLEEPLKLERGRWLVGVEEITFTHSFPNVTEEASFKVFMKGNAEPAEYLLPKGQYESAEEIVDALKDRGLVIEGDVGLTVTDRGLGTRANVRFKPREGLLSKISNLFSVKVDLSLKDIFK